MQEYAEKYGLDLASRKITKIIRSEVRRHTFGTVGRYLQEKVLIRYKLAMVSTWGILPVETLILDEGFIQCLFYRHGLRTFKAVDKLSYVLFFMTMETDNCLVLDGTIICGDLSECLTPVRHCFECRNLVANKSGLCEAHR